MSILDYWKNITIETINADKIISTDEIQNHLSIEELIKKAIIHKHKVEIDYQKTDGTNSTRILNYVSFSEAFIPYGSYIKGKDDMRKEERTFKISRIKSVKIL